MDFSAAPVPAAAPVCPVICHPPDVSPKSAKADTQTAAPARPSPEGQPTSSTENGGNDPRPLLRDKIRNLVDRVGAPPTTGQGPRPSAPPLTDSPRPSPGRSIESLASSGQISPLPESLRKSLIMIVDDEKLNVLTVCRYLQHEGYESFLPLTDPRQAMQLLKSHKPDCLLLDIQMPQVTGLDILRAKAVDNSLDRIPTLILTASNDPQTKREALALGTNDFLTKPVDPIELTLRVRNALIMKQHLDRMAGEAARLEALVQRRTAELLQSRQQLILSLARAAEHRDNDTANHVIRVGRYAGIIARKLGWPPAQAAILEQAAQLHDVGKIGVPDSILFKPGKLDPQEYALMKDHCAIGKAIIEPYSEKELEVLRRHTQVGSEILIGPSSPMLVLAARIAQTHHERWDGAGYPLGLAREDIPIEGRIVAVADVYDALSSARPYKPPFPREKCFEIMREGSGTQFDPRVLQAFFAATDEILDVQLRFVDLVADHGSPAASSS